MTDKENSAIASPEIHQLEKRILEIEAERSSILNRLEALRAALKKNVQEQTQGI